MISFCWMQRGDYNCSGISYEALKASSAVLLLGREDNGSKGICGICFRNDGLGKPRYSTVNCDGYFIILVFFCLSVFR
jgi:hypothetical protein